jgi:hypothetical protein
MATSATVVDSQVAALTPVLEEEEGESAFEAPPGMQRWLEEKTLQSSSSSLISAVTDPTSEEDREVEQTRPKEEEQGNFPESLPREEKEKLSKLLARTADASAIKERVFSTQIRPPPTPPQDVSMYTNTRRTARSKQDRERGFTKSDYLVDALLRSHTEGERQRVAREQENTSQYGAGRNGMEPSFADKYEVPVHIQDNDSSPDSGEESGKEPHVIPRQQVKDSEFSRLGQQLSERAWGSLKALLFSFFSMDVAQYYFREYLQRLPRVIGYTFAGVGFLYCIFAFMFLLLSVGCLVGWFIFCAIIVSAIVSCILLVGLVVFVICFLCVCTFTVSLFTVLFAAKSLLDHPMAKQRKLKP